MPDSDWYAPSDRIPRQDQTVRVLTFRGVDHEAQFVVAHTDDWPSGASWALANGRAVLPFTDVVSWSPDRTARPPRPESDEEQTSRDGVPDTPAILREIVTEVERTGTVLRLLPPDHLDWSPHPDIPSMRTLGLRLVRIVARIGWMLDLEEIEQAFEPDLPDLRTVHEIVDTYAANEADVRRLALKTTPDDLRAPWTLARHDRPVARTTRGGALRLFGLTPIVYHRAEIALMLTAFGLPAPHPYPLWAFDDANASAPPSSDT